MLRTSSTPLFRFGILLLGAALLLHPVQAAAGEVQGSVVLSQRGNRLAVNRYPGAAGGNQPHPVVPIPAVAVLSAAGTTARAAAPARMAQRDTAFAPPLLVIPVGTTVAFPNEDPFFHNVFSYSRPKRFDLGRYPRGESKSVTFDQPGAVKLFCEVHKWMRAAILVVTSPHHAVVAENGSFRIPDVPAGRYTLTIWHFDRGEVERVVDVPAQGAVNVQITL